MEPRRTSRVIDPKVRKVGFFTPGPPPDRTQSGPPGSSSSPTVSDMSQSDNSLSPVMIPPPRHAVGLQFPTFLSRRQSLDNFTVESQIMPDYVFGSSTLHSSSSRISDIDFSEDSANWIRRSNSAKLASSLPTGGFDFTATSKMVAAAKNDHEGEGTDLCLNLLEKDGAQIVDAPSRSTSRSLKDKTTKAERRAKQEAQRAAKAATKGNNKSVAASVGTAAEKPPIQKKEGPPITLSDRQPEKERKKDVPPPRMQFDDKNRVEKAKRRAVVKQTEAKNRVELFRHLPQYERGTQLPDLESKFFQLDVHAAVYRVGLKYLAGDITEGNARCIAMLQAFKEVIRDYTTPPHKTLSRDLTAKINSYVSFLIECRPQSISMGNAIRFLKPRIANLPPSLSESEAKVSLCTDIDRFINEKIVLADKVIVKHAVTKIRDGDVILTYGSSSLVEMILLYALEDLGKKFRVVVVDSRPELEGQEILGRLVGKGLMCTYTHINAVSYVMRDVTRVFVGAASVLSNGTVYSRVGTACVAMVAHAFRVPVLICCEAYKFHERVQLDSICANELGDPNDISKVSGRRDVNYLDNLHTLASKENLQLLNLLYDATPADYISMIITDYGMIPPTSVPAIVREYGREHLLI